MNKFLKYSLIGCIGAFVIWANLPEEKSSISNSSSLESYPSSDNSESNTNDESEEVYEEPSVNNDLVTCPLCSGTGVVDLANNGNSSLCPACSGNGKVSASDLQGLYQTPSIPVSNNSYIDDGSENTQKTICTSCSSSGTCNFCHGSGTTRNPYDISNVSVCTACQGSGVCSICGGSGYY